MISRAISSETSSDQRSAVLKATTLIGFIVLPWEQVGDRGFQIGPGRSWSPEN